MQASTVLFAKIGSALAEYEAYEQEIVLHAARVAVVQQHVEVLIMQELSIARFITTLYTYLHNTLIVSIYSVHGCLGYRDSGHN